MKRMIATAKPLCDAVGLEMQLRDGLKEIRYGEWEGLTQDYVKEHCCATSKLRIRSTKLSTNRFTLSGVLLQSASGISLKKIAGAVFMLLTLPDLLLLDSLFPAYLLYGYD